MQETLSAYDYATIRLVPRVEREEFFNVGVIVSCPAHRFLETKIAVDAQKLLSFSPETELTEVCRYLDTIRLICAGDETAGVIGRMKQRERFYWLTAQRSTIIQCSPIHTGLTDDPRQTLERLFLQMVA